MRGTLFEARTAAYDPPLAIAGDPSAVADARFMAAFRDVFLAAALTAAAAALVALLRRGAQVEAAPAEVSSPRGGTVGE